VVAQQRCTPRPQGRSHSRRAREIGDEVGPLVEDAEAVGEEDRVVGQHEQLGVGRAERSGIDGMPMDHGVHVRPSVVDGRVHEGFEVVAGSPERLAVVQVEGDDIVRLDLVEGDPHALDPDRPGARLAGADVPQRQVDIALEGDNATRCRHLPAERVAHGGESSPFAERRWVGG
jgi:hypothetical protein